MNLKDKHFLNAYVKQATLQHEKLDGTGYPLRISGEEIKYEVSQIAGITDVYDAVNIR